MSHLWSSVGDSSLTWHLSGWEYHMVYFSAQEKYCPLKEEKRKQENLSCGNIPQSSFTPSDSLRTTCLLANQCGAQQCHSPLGCTRLTNRQCIRDGHPDQAFSGLNHNSFYEE
jgi:hypothetical protein